MSAHPEVARLARLYGTPGVPLPVEAVALGSKLPPFGREVAEVIAAGRLPNCYVYAGPHAWARAKRRRAQFGPGSAMVLPPGADPAEFRWPRMPGGVLVDACDLSRAEAMALARALGSAGTAPVYAVIDGGNDAIIVRAARWRAGHADRA